MSYWFLENRYQDGSWESLPGEHCVDAHAAILRAEFLSRDAISYGMVRAIQLDGGTGEDDICLAEFSAGHLPYDIVFTADGFHVVPIQVEVAVSDAISSTAVVSDALSMYVANSAIDLSALHAAPEPRVEITPPAPTREDLRPARGIRIRNPEEG